MREARQALRGGLASCSLCPERQSAFAPWTCGNCEEAVAERLPEEAVRALLWRVMIKAGYPADRAGLSFWELWLVGVIEEMENER